MNPGIIIGGLAGAALLGGAVASVNMQVDAAQERLEKGIVAAADKPKVAVADDAEAAYCTPKFKEVLQRVLFACGLVSEQRRGCKPADVQRLAAISDEEFNALFTPLQERGGVVLFADGKHELDDAGKKLVEELWLQRKGARYFFVVARASKTGTPKFNRALSHKRANSVKFHVEDKFQEKELDKLMGTLWLGYDYAQLGKEYCDWNVSREGKSCNQEAINRSAFVSWVDCRL
jgi:outer membrane protein OmpA-like peptidoglycan-associated protein